jgi:hypothetical protein
VVESTLCTHQVEILGLEDFFHLVFQAVEGGARVKNLLSKQAAAAPRRSAPRQAALLVPAQQQAADAQRWTPLRRRDRAALEERCSSALPRG